jgi:hypothetical protein
MTMASWRIFFHFWLNRKKKYNQKSEQLALLVMYDSKELQSTEATPTEPHTNPSITTCWRAARILLVPFTWPFSWGENCPVFWRSSGHLELWTCTGVDFIFRELNAILLYKDPRPSLSPLLRYPLLTSSFWLWAAVRLWRWKFQLGWFGSIFCERELAREHNHGFPKVQTVDRDSRYLPGRFPR